MGEVEIDFLTSFWILFSFEVKSYVFESFLAQDLSPVDQLVAVKLVLFLKHVVKAELDAVETGFHRIGKRADNTALELVSPILDQG